MPHTINKSGYSGFNKDEVCKIMQSYSEYYMGTICRYLKCIKFSIENTLYLIKRLVFQFIVVHSDVENEQLRGSQTQSEFPLIKYNKMGDTFM